ncbi:hypothetical protein [Nonomuraea sp. bgisy101]|uniref:hypothetical protein n=1 Tax=Nonomuraea sp. bgisy101 TaxID=3413784 RepID=UPI003D748C18
MTPHLHIGLVNPSVLVISRVNSRMTQGRVELLLDRTGVDPYVLEPLQIIGARTLSELVPMLRPGRPPTVRYFMERDIPGLVYMDVTPYQADIYLERGLIPQDLADELAGHSTNLLRHFTL